jgi:NADPH-dependent glutamate synthase beta subunit-like oxidoreductase/NAD(P)H-flavin reductase
MIAPMHEPIREPTSPRLPQLGLPGFSWADLHDARRLADLTAAFDRALAAEDPLLHARYQAHRSGAALLRGPAESELLVALAPHLSRFLGILFGVEDQLAALRAAAGREVPLFRVKRDFIQRRVFRKGAPSRPAATDFSALDAQVSALLEAARKRDPRASAASASAVPSAHASHTASAVSGPPVPSLDEEMLFATVVDTLLDAERALSIRFDANKPGPLEAAAFDAWRTLARAIGLGLAEVRPHDPFAGLAALGGAEDAAELEQVRALLGLLDRWAFALALHGGGGRAHAFSLLRLPRPLDFQQLVPLRRPRADLPNALVGPPEHQRRRDGFRLTDARASAREARSEIDYCLYCHEREKDSCSSGFHEAKPATGRQADPALPYRKNPLGIPLTGCPLEERISEAHLVAREGCAVGALALISIDNPMAPGTGHRICNDCMKACVFQKQEPVNIPQIETRILGDVLGLRWGFEIWSLLTRWNPLLLSRQHPRPYTGLNVLVVGMGPAGYTLAHHLLNEGFGVVGVDGLKVEPLLPELLGRGPGSDPAGVPRPVEWVHEQFGKPLDERVTSGFGGVSEYGITVRWDKSFLDILHLNLARRAQFRLYGGTRFGGTLTLDDAWALGFDHVALASGAGKPTVIPLKNNLLRGIRKASDFLMALQLTGAFKRNALANLQIGLPAVVIGGGLTAIDTATELAAYYPVQVEKLLARHEALCARLGHGANGGAAGRDARGEERILSLLDEEERGIYLEQLEHGRAVRAERRRAQAKGEPPDLAKLVALWGGVTLAYRKGLEDAPAYRLNHEEVAKALEEGIVFAEGLSPLEALPDAFGAVRAVRFARQQREGGKWSSANEVVELPARTVCVAAGTSPNVTLGKENPGLFELDPEHHSFRGFRFEDGELVPAGVTEDLSGAPGFFTSYRKEADGGRTDSGQAGAAAPLLVSYFGDNHPAYAGSVVKAMASAKDGYPHIAALFGERLRELDALSARGGAQAERTLALLEDRFRVFAARLDEELLATVHEVNRLTPTIVEVVVRARAAARRFQPGQFYRLQNFEALAREVDGTRLLMEGLALTGAWVDREKGLLGLIVLEMGASSRLCAKLLPGEPVVVMGPTGAPSTIPRGEDVVLCGGGLGNAVLFSISKALRANGCRVIYFAGYRRAEDIFKRDQIEEATDVVVWAVDKGSPPPAPRRPQDRAFSGNMVEAMVAYGTGALGIPSVPLRGVSRIIAIGSDRMMAAVAAARRGPLAGLLRPDHVGIASINSPMQCMLKEICAQCLQKHRDPKTFEESVVFTCFDQDQDMDRIDWENLRARLRQTSLQEKLSALWLDQLLASESAAR